MALVGTSTKINKKETSLRVEIPRDYKAFLKEHSKSRKQSITVFVTDLLESFIKKNEVKISKKLAKKGRVGCIPKDHYGTTNKNYDRCSLLMSMHTVDKRIIKSTANAFEMSVADLIKTAIHEFAIANNLKIKLHPIDPSIKPENNLGIYIYDC